MDLIELIKFLILGFVQGFTEGLPVSSSGHLLIFKELLHVNGDYTTLAIVTNFGSLVAITLVFYKDIVKLVTSFFKYLKTKEEIYKADFKFCWLLVIGCIPAGIVGVLVKVFDVFTVIENNVKIVGISLLLTAVMLFIIKDFKGKKSSNKMTFKDAFIVGLFQIMGVFPGVSRSGSTITGSMITGLDRDTAFKYSFMLYIPMSLAAMILEVKDLFNSNLSSITWMYYGLATILAGFMTFITIKWFRKVLNNGGLKYFVYYCLIAGLAVIIFL